MPVDTQVRGVLKTDGSGDLDMKTGAIKNVKTPTNSSDATNKSWVDKQVSTVEEKLQKYTIDSRSLKDEFRLYLMEDENESSSESGIRVDGIVETVKSPHKINKKAYDLKLIKNKQNNYVSRLGFNMYKLPQGEYIICVEFFPFVMSNVTVNAVSSSLNVGQQTTNLITKNVKGHYTRSIIHLHKYTDLSTGVLNVRFTRW